MQKIARTSLNKIILRKVCVIMLFSCLIISKAISQDTIFFNAGWEKCVREETSYFRLISATNPLQVSDFYLSGKLQMKGTFTDTSYSNENGYFEYYHENGNVYKKCFYVQGQVNGMFQEFHPNGKIEIEGNYILGNRSGIFKEFDSTGFLLITTPYKQGKKEGEALGYYPNGKIRRKEIYKNGLFKEGFCYTQDGKDTSYFPHMTTPMIGDNEDILYNILGKNIQYPPICRELGIEGKVILKFMVNEEGKMDNITVIYSKHLLFTQESLRVMKLMPTFTPGTYEGVKKAMEVTMPIKFELN